MEILSPSVIREIFQSPIEAFENRHKVFRMLLKEGLITEACPERNRRKRVRLILSWRHTGFHIHNEGKVVAASQILRLVQQQEPRPLTPYQKQCKSAWARLIRKIYEVEPLLCPQ